MNRSREEGEELYALCAQAWEMRASVWFPEAIGAILEWHDRLELSRFEQRQEEIGRVVRVLRAVAT